MSMHRSVKKITPASIRAMKGKERIVSLTAYTKATAQFMSDFVELIIVGDSVGMVAYGFDSTLPVTLEMMIAHGAAVVRGAGRSCVVVDMPYGSYQESKEMAFRNAAKILRETGADAVKIEAGAELMETVEYLVSRGVPVMAHIGLKPQHVRVVGGFKAQGRSAEAANAIVDDALALQRAGAFALLIEGVYEGAADAVTKSVDVPVIGIGAGRQCDGQVLVTEDVLGLFTDYTPRFAKKYADLAVLMRSAFSSFREEVRAGIFPAPEHCFRSRE